MGPAPAKPDDLLKFFDTLALFRTVGQQKRARPTRVRKWMAPVVVRARGAGAVAHRETVQAVLAETSALTGLNFRHAGGARSLDNLVTIYFLSKEEMERLYGAGTTNLCYTQTRGRGGALRTARVRVREGFEDCLHHEFMHALGFDNHWPGHKTGVGASSALANRHSAERANGYSEWDRLAIRLLYDPRIKPGMPRDEALTIAERIIPEIATV